LIIINQEMRKLIKSILLEVEVGDLKIRPRGDNRCERAKIAMAYQDPNGRTSSKISVPRPRAASHHKGFLRLGFSLESLKGATS